MSNDVVIFESDQQLVKFEMKIKSSDYFNYLTISTYNKSFEIISKENIILNRWTSLKVKCTYL